MAYPLSDSDMKKMIPTLKVVTYTELLNANSLDDILDEKGRLMLLYLTESAMQGHWVCLLKLRDKPVVEYFDPYGGFKADGEKKWISKEKQREFGQDTNHLTKLLKSSPYTIKSSKVKFQKDKADVNTCGRHCLTRLYFKHLDLKQYAKMVEDACREGHMNPDEFVCGFTYNLIKR